MERHQIDLVSMKDQAIEYQGTVYRYILTVQDIFSRFLWLRPMSRKKSSVVAHELMTIYREHGPPKILQCDNGGEFKGNTTTVCKKIGIKVINSRAYHPQSQGKVERSHRTLRDKMRYDMLKEGTNWVKNLPKYQSIINDEVKQELAGRSPFQIYYCRKSNYLLKPNADSDPESEGDDALMCRKVWPTLSKKTILNLESRRKLLKTAAYDASSKCARTMVNRSLKRFPLPIYRLNEKVIIRYPFGFRKKSPKRRFSILGKVIERNILLSKYKIRYKNPETKNIETNSILVSDITSKTISKEHKRKKYTSVDELLKYANREKKVESFLISLTSEERMNNVFERAGYIIRLNPSPDGNCQFRAIADQLQRQKVSDSTASQIRQSIVDYMVEYRQSPFNEREDFSNLFDRERYLRYNEYINMMREDSTFGDHLTLQAISEFFFVRIHVVSSEGSNYDRIIVPQEDVAEIPTLTLGYYPEGNGEHYISIDGNGDFSEDSPYQQNECESEHGDAEIEFKISSVDTANLEDNGRRLRTDGHLGKADRETGNSVIQDELSELESEEESRSENRNSEFEDNDYLEGNSAEQQDDLLACHEQDLNERKNSENNDEEPIVQDEDNAGEFVCLIANAACIAAMVCICSSSKEEDVVDKENDLYLADIEQYIPPSNIISVLQIRKWAGSGGLYDQLRDRIQRMDRPIGNNGRKKNWSSALLKVKFLKYGWYKIVDVVW